MSLSFKKGLIITFNYHLKLKDKDSSWYWTWSHFDCQAFNKRSRRSSGAWIVQGFHFETISVHSCFGDRVLDLRNCFKSSFWPLNTLGHAHENCDLTVSACDQKLPDMKMMNISANIGPIDTIQEAISCCLTLYGRLL